MSIKTLWNKFLVWAEYKEEVKPIEAQEVPIIEDVYEVLPPPREATHQEAVRMKHGREGKEALLACFYGTLVARTEYNEVNRYKKKRAHDGWRHGVSNPFLFGGRTYDVLRHSDDTTEQFEELMAKLEAMEGG